MCVKFWEFYLLRVPTRKWRRNIRESEKKEEKKRESDYLEAKGIKNTSIQSTWRILAFCCMKVNWQKLKWTEKWQL